MPRLLPFDALSGAPADAIEGPPLRARWAAILAVALAMTATATDWPEAWDETRGLVPAIGDRTDWNAEALTAAPEVADTEGMIGGIDDPVSARTAHLTAPDLTLDLMWEQPLTLAAVSAETYKDAFGSGIRLGIAADSTTQGGPNCLNARIDTGGETTRTQWCSRSDQHEPVDMNAFLGKEADDVWAPGALYVTQTANLDPPDDALRLIDFYGFGLTTGNAFDTGLWPGNYWLQGENNERCEDPLLQRRLDDLHLTDRHDDPEAHQSTIELIHSRQSAYPAEHRLLTPACAPIAGGLGRDWTAAGPFLIGSPTPMAGIYPYSASTREARPLRTAFVLDLRTCDTDPAHCTSDGEPDLAWVNDGTGRTWMSELLDRT